MIHSNADKSSHTPQWKELHGKAKLQYLYDYYKLPFVIFCVVIYIIIYLLYGHFTKKDNLLYVAFANVNIGETLSGELLEGYLSYSGANPDRSQIYTYQDLYLSDDPSDENAQYAYVSSTKILAAIDAKHLDLVILNQKALDIFLQKEYLTNLATLLPDTLDVSYENDYAITLSDTSFFKEAGFTEEVYLGIIANSPRMDEAVNYIEFLH